ncbi:MAG: ATP-dependent 6-phosphofructokinase [Fibrobacterota bacterium]
MNSEIINLGKCSVKSPLKLSKVKGDKVYNYVDDTDRVLYNVTYGTHKSSDRPGDNSESFEMAGPREYIYFDPSKINAAVVTCGGLCPGLNDVIRAIVMELHYRYNVRSIKGISYGYNGFLPENSLPVKELTPSLVSDIHKAGGTILGSSRGGGEKVTEIVDALERMNISILFTIGGDGTLKGAHDIAQEIIKRGLKISVVGIPKTIDNDISFVQKTFGFETAFSKGMEAIDAAHVEAKGAINGIGLVKLMGRHSGFVAAKAALATNDVNFLLIPEVPFALDGGNGLFIHLHERLKQRQHAVIVVAEGAGQELFKSESSEKDQSGNIKFQDIGTYLKNKIGDYFKEKDFPVNIKYIDPSYIIRATPANPNDSVFCADLGRNAVHAAMAGKTNMCIGMWNTWFTHVPIDLVTSQRRRIDPEEPLWWHVLESTGQPMSMI